MADNQLDLRFGPGPNVGFTSAGIESFSNLRPAAVVRELIQNSLDAAVEANVPTAVVRFVLFTVLVEDIPGIKSYRRAFESAVKTQLSLGNRELPRPAQGVVRKMREALKQEEVDVLSVIDNGVGLNKRRMTALLSDGVSSKFEGSTGTFGNGHSVAIPASDLRYVLYAGVTEEDGEICGGHAVIASHQADKKQAEHHPSADGFLITKFRSGSPSQPYEFASKKRIPKFIRNEIDEIRGGSTHGTGTAVILPAFNHFREKKELWDMVSRATACNFFQAVHDGRLEVEVEYYGGDKYVLNKKELGNVLDKWKDEKRSKSFLSGQRAFEAYKVLNDGNSQIVETAMGKVRIVLLTESLGTTRIHLCRNGMHITEITKNTVFNGRFNDRIPFHALILAEASGNSEVHRLLCDAEGPLHNELRFKNLSKEDQTDLKEALVDIREWLRRNLDEINDKSFLSEDFLALDYGDENNAANGGTTRRSFWGTPSALKRGVADPLHLSNKRDPKIRPIPRKPGGGKNTPNPDRPRNTRVIIPSIQAASIPVGPRRCRIEIETQKACEDATLRLYVDENLDATCDRIRSDSSALVFLSDVKMKDHPNPKLVLKDDNAIGVHLGDLPNDTVVELDVEYIVPPEFASLTTDPSLRIELAREPQQSSGDADE